MGQILLLTGRPGVGKTTVFLDVLSRLKARGFIVGGFVSREVREGGRRVGFEVEDLHTGEKGWLARVDVHSHLRVGRYGVLLDVLEGIGVRSLEAALADPKITLIGIDEIAPMELKSPRFKGAVIECFNSGKTVLGTLSLRLVGEVESWARSNAAVEVVEMKGGDRGGIADHVYRKVIGGHAGKTAPSNQLG